MTYATGRLANLLMNEMHSRGRQMSREEISEFIRDHMYEVNPESLRASLPSIEVRYEVTEGELQKWNSLCTCKFDEFNRVHEPDCRQAEAMMRMRPETTKSEFLKLIDDASS